MTKQFSVAFKQKMVQRLALSKRAQIAVQGDLIFGSHSQLRALAEV